jgi:hypothetical protein
VSMVASKPKAPRDTKKKAPKTTKKKTIKKSKPKPKSKQKPKAKKSKNGAQKKQTKPRQTKLSFEPPTVTPLTSPKGGGRMEESTFAEEYGTFAASVCLGDVLAGDDYDTPRFYDRSSRSPLFHS